MNEWRREEVGRRTSDPVWGSSERSQGQRLGGGTGEAGEETGKTGQREGRQWPQGESKGRRWFWRREG